MIFISSRNLVLGVGGGVNTFIYHENGPLKLKNRDMSTFTNYETKAASDYDIVRIPVGIEVKIHAFCTFSCLTDSQIHRSHNIDCDR